MPLNIVGSSRIPDTPSRFATVGPREPRVVETIQRIASPIVEGIVAVAPLFWLALILAFVMATLGIIPNR